MWGRVSTIAGKGYGLAGQGIRKAGEAASYVGEVIAPVHEDEDEERSAEAITFDDSGATQKINDDLDFGEEERKEAYGGYRRNYGSVDSHVDSSAENEEAEVLSMIPNPSDAVPALSPDPRDREPSEPELYAGLQDTMKGGPDVDSLRSVDHYSARATESELARYADQATEQPEGPTRRLSAEEVEEEDSRRHCIDKVSPCPEEEVGDVHILSPCQGCDEDRHSVETALLRQQLNHLKEERQYTDERLATANEEARAAAVRMDEMQMEMAGLRESLRAAEEEMAQSKQRSVFLEQQSESLQESIHSAFAELPRVYEIITEADRRLPKEKGAGLPELVKGAASALLHMEACQEEWRRRLQHLAQVQVDQDASGSLRVDSRLEGDRSQQIDVILSLLERTSDARSRRDSQTDQAPLSEDVVDQLMRREQELKNDLVDAKDTIEALRDQSRCLTEEIQAARRQSDEAAGEIRQLTHTNNQFKQVVDQMRELAKGHNGHVEALKRELQAALEANKRAEDRADQMERSANDMRTKLQLVKHNTDQLQVSSEDKRVLMQQLEEARRQVDESQEAIMALEQDFSVQLRAVREHRDEAVLSEKQMGARMTALKADLALAKQDKEQCETALNNLRGVLEGFHAEREAETETLRSTLRKELDREAEKFSQKELAIQVSLERQLSESKAAGHKALLAERRLRAVKEGEIVRMKEELQKSRAALEEALDRLRGGQDDSLDRRLVTNLIVRYVGSRHKREVLELMARMLNFTEEEEELVGLRGKTPLAGILTAMFSPSTDDHRVTTQEISGNNLADMWMDFLMAETAEHDGRDSRDRANGTNSAHATVIAGENISNQQSTYEKG